MSTSFKPRRSNWKACRAFDNRRRSWLADVWSLQVFCNNVGHFTVYILKRIGLFRQPNALSVCHRAVIWLPVFVVASRSETQTPSLLRTDSNSNYVFGWKTDLCMTHVDWLIVSGCILVGSEATRSKAYNTLTETGRGPITRGHLRSAANALQLASIGFE